MAYGVETLYTRRGTLIDVEEHKAPTGVAGIVAHWGERIPDPELKDRISEVFPGVELDESTGFDLIYHQKDGITRKQGIADELEVAKLVGRRTMEANGWKARDIAGLFVGSGVPIADDKRYPNYAKAIAKKLNLSPDTYLHATYAACASGGHELIHALSKPEMQGKPVLVMGMEGITFLTPFDPRYADHYSMRFFSNGAAGIGLIPGENMTLLDSFHERVIDSDRTLTAKMTYGHLLDPGGKEWQEKDGVSMMRMPTPDNDDLRLTMNGRHAGSFFARNGVRLLMGLMKDHEERFPENKADYVVAHHPSKGVNQSIMTRFKREGIEIDIPWKVHDGNSSAATSLIAELRLLDEAHEGTTQLFTAYGAGGSFDGAHILNAAKPHDLSSAQG